MSEQQAAAMAAEANDWYAGLQSVAPTALRFSMAVKDVIIHTEDGPAREKSILFKAYTPVGAIVLHLPPAVADSLAEALTEHSRLARTGLVVAQ